MKTATQNLENDHVYILRLIDVMEKMVINCETNTSHMELVVSLIQHYADGFHHAKEENLLFPLLVQKGFSNEQGPVSVMLHDHAEGRNFVKKLSNGISLFKAGNVSALPEIYHNMQGYIDLLRAHIGKENNVLFRMADKALNEAEQEELLNKFAKVEIANYTNGQIQKFITDIEGLEVIYNEHN
ncbi:MAG: hemerythrin domain-containing protein [Paludibacter sp.]|nr:hemerythrin domain-containing protein [Paludibacter sp.]